MRPPVCDFSAGGHAGLLTFLDVAAAREKRPARVKVQVTGPLTLGVALARSGVPAPRAFRRAAEVARAWSVAIEEKVAAARFPVLVSCSSSTNPRWCRGSAATSPSIARRRSTCCRARSRRSIA